MNRVYLYDGNYYSLINLIIELLKSKIKPINIKCDNNYEMNLLDEVVFLKVDNNYNFFDKMPISIKRATYYLFLSDQKDKELLIYEFLKSAFKYKENVFRYRNIDSVNETLKVIKYVGSEAHKYKGFLRFKCINNKFYFGEIEPNNNIIGILVHHFKKRMNDPWIIHDVKRNIYAIYDLKKVTYLSEKDILKMNLKIDSTEENFEDLWKTFFKTISIKERKNLKCQMNFMPKRYWSHMLEMEDQL